MLEVGVVGASGFTGAELLRLVSGHPEMEVAVATADTQAGTPIAELYPSLAGAYGGRRFESYDGDRLDGLDLVFLGLPHGASQSLAGDLLGRTGPVIDLAADFRLKDAGLYDTWYGEPHAHPELIDRFVYGLPEVHRAEMGGAEGIAVPGCYPTAATLALRPLAVAGAIETAGVIVDAASGVSGAGRPPKPGTTFCAVDENFAAYGLLDHRHTPEMEQEIGATVLFTPHLAPMNRGILATCYARPRGAVSTSDLLDVLHAAYEHEPFVVVVEGSPSTKATLGSNAAHVTVRVDARTGWVVALAAIDNLGKGASGQALQCANVVSGLPEGLGLSAVGVYP
jgi:N-acetyl-gamma-glutamyl-phosphate reductase